MNDIIITPEVLRENCLEFFNGDELAVQVWMSKYALKNLKGEYVEYSPQERYLSIAKELARIDKKYASHGHLVDDYYYYLINRIITPAGSGLAGIANPYSLTSLGNCFVVSLNKEDSYGSILKVDEKFVQICKRRGGIGTDLSDLRPTNSIVTNAAGTSTGAISFIPRLSNSLREVAQDGRRGAGMLSLSVNYPDIEKFIELKLNPKLATGANLSVRVTDEFMQAVECEGQHVLRYPVDIPRQEVLGEDPKNIRRKVAAKDIWNKMMKAAWQCAEPGILFWDKIIKESPADCYQLFESQSVNPCFPKSEQLLTSAGYFTFEELFNTQFSPNVICDNRISYNDTGKEHCSNWIVDRAKTGVSKNQASAVFLTQISAPIIELETAKGFNLKCTPDHHIATTIGMVEAKDLTPEHEILISVPDTDSSILNKVPQSTEEILAVLIGLITGDGSYDKSRQRVHIEFWGSDKIRMQTYVCNLLDVLHTRIGPRFNSKNREFTKYFVFPHKTLDKIRISSAWLANILQEYEFHHKTKHTVPRFIMNNCSTSIGKFYTAAMMYCDGSVQGSEQSGYSVRLSQSNKTLLQQIQLILHSNGLIFSLYKRRDEMFRSMPDGKGGKQTYKTKANYELISSQGAFVKYREFIGFLGHNEKETKLSIYHNFKSKESFVDSVVSISVLPNETVYCIQEPITRSIIVNGISTRRCGELPLSKNDSCRLLSVNLTAFVLDPFTKEATFDWVAFLTAAKIATVMMDDIIDLELEKIDLIIAKIISDKESDSTKETELQLWKDIKQSCELGRRAGISAIGFGDMLAMLNKPYATHESNLYCQNVQYQFALQCYKTSIELAKQRGAFPVFDYELEDKNPFLNRLFANNLREYSEMKLVGRRNISLLTIPPSGSLSILLGNQTSGIEPAFALVYKRKRKVLNTDSNITFVDATGDSFQEYNVLHPGFQKWAEVNGYGLTGKTYEDLIDLGKRSPYAGCTANEIDPLKKIELQGMLQLYIDHSISVTTNLPATATIDEVSKIYMAAWKAGCKGCTVYRDGSRDGILTTTSTKTSSEFEYRDSPKRPRDLPCDIFHPTIGGIRYVVLVGLYDNKPFEVFAFKNGQSTLPLELTKGILRKQKSKHYNLLAEDKSLLIDNLGAQFGFPEWNSITRLLSWGLRHGGDVTFAVEQLNEAEGVVTDVSKVLARTLKKYAKPQRKAGDKCPECGEPMRIEGGCATCYNPSCGYSRCS